MYLGHSMWTFITVYMYPYASWLERVYCLFTCTLACIIRANLLFICLFPRVLGIHQSLPYLSVSFYISRSHSTRPCLHLCTRILSGLRKGISRRLHVAHALLEQTVVLGAWRRAVGGIVVGQGVLGEEFGVILVRLPGFDELTDLLLCGFHVSLRRPLAVSWLPDWLGHLERWLWRHNPSRSLLDGRSLPQLEAGGVGRRHVRGIFVLFVLLLGWAGRPLHRASCGFFLVQHLEDGGLAQVGGNGGEEDGDRVRSFFLSSPAKATGGCKITNAPATKGTKRVLLTQPLALSPRASHTL